MENISYPVAVLFIITTILTVWLLYKATKNLKALLLILIWMTLTAILGLTGFYSNFEASPSRFIFLLPPGLLFVIIFSLSSKGKTLIKNADSAWLTLIHIVRLPVEITLYYVFVAGLIPQLMTFEGYNFDILSGITAPIIYYFCFKRKTLSNRFLLIWNYTCLLLLINILAIALLCAKTPFQALALDQPNTGVAYFPLVWLPAVVVPIVLFSHIAAIQKLKSVEYNVTQ